MINYEKVVNFERWFSFSNCTVDTMNWYVGIKSMLHLDQSEPEFTVTQNTNFNEIRVGLIFLIRLEKN